jgi:chromosomal replication initiation ATPase DnaA
MDAREGEQLLLGLDHRPALGRDDFLVSPRTAPAVEMLRQTGAWPEGRLALAGPARAGKSHLAAVWRAETGAGAITLDALAPDTAGGMAAGPLLVEDVHRLASMEGSARAARERGLLHLMNAMAAEGRPLLLSGRGRPAAWRAALPDLASRLAAMTVAEIAPPDDRLLGALLVKFFADRQIEVDPRVVRYLRDRVERSVEAAERVVGALDRLSLRRKRPVTIALAAEALAAERT